MRRIAWLVSAVALAGCQEASAPLAPESAADPAAASLSTAAQAVPGRYIVVFDGGVTDASSLARQLLGTHGGTLRFVYEHALKGFAAELSASAAAALQRHPQVAYVEQDQVVHAFGEVPTGVARIFAPGNAEIDIDGTDDYRVDVDVAIIDTGIDLDHPDLNVNVAGSVNCSGGSPTKSSCTSGGDDDNNHGTHVAGSVGALDNGSGVVGVAPGARLWAVKVLRADGSGYMSWIVAGIDYVTSKASEIEVANMSLGCECSSDAMNTAISNSVAAGVVYAVAAGNSDKDASTFSPANHPDVITVSALADFDGLSGGSGAPTCRTDQDDTLADFSNFGATVEIAAPGVCIYSTIPGGYATYSGTSMASPHVAGAAALLAASGSYTPSGIRSTLISEGNTGWTDDSGDGIQEPLLDVSDATVFNPALVAGSGSGGGTTDSPPTASYTYSCTDLSCSFDGTGSTDDNGISSYAWEFGDGATASGSQVSHTYGAAGTYTVTLTVTDGSSQTDSEAKSVSVSSCVRNPAGKCK